MAKFQKGQSGNPNGRPKGARSKLAETFFEQFLASWTKRGEEVFEAVATNDPSTYLRVAASIMPKEIEATVRTVSAKELRDDELADIAVGSGEGTADAPVDPAQLN